MVQKQEKQSTQKKPSKRKANYLNNKDLLKQVVLSKKQGKMTDELAKMLMLLTARYGKKGNFANYTYNEDMQAFAIMALVKTWNSFNPERSQNPFAFFTQCIKHSFLQYLKMEKKQRSIRDELLVDSGLTPSYNYQMEYEEHQRLAHDEEDHEQHMENANRLEAEQTDEFVGY